MEWVSASVRGRRHRLVSTAGFSEGRARPRLINAARAPPRFILPSRPLSLFVWLRNENADAGLWRARDDGRERRALSDGSRGTAAVWQLGKFIAIDFVISSLSIVSTGSFWWIARKLFLQTCFFNLHLTHTHTQSPGPRSAPTKRYKTFIKRKRWCVEQFWWRKRCSWEGHSLGSFWRIFRAWWNRYKYVFNTAKYARCYSYCRPW